MPESRDPVGLYERLSVALEAAGFRVRRTTAEAGFNQQGTAFFVSANGHLMTSAHVVGAYDRVYATWDGQDYLADVVAFDEDRDLAMLKLRGRTPSRVTPLALAKKRHRRLGTAVVALGYPSTWLLGGSVSATEGVVSGLTGLRADEDTFRFTAAVQPGNSGGPIIDAQGRVLGVVAATLNPFVMAPAGMLPQNVNFGVRAERSSRVFAKARVATVPEQSELTLDEAARAVVKVRSRQAAFNLWSLDLNYQSVGRSVVSLDLSLVDEHAEEVVMRVRSGAGGRASVGMLVSKVVDALKRRHIFRAKDSDRAQAQRKVQRPADEARIMALAPQLRKCAASLPKDRRRQLRVGLHVTPSGYARYPSMRMGRSKKELVSRATVEAAQDCMRPLLTGIRFPNIGGDPRFYLVDLVDLAATDRGRRGARR